LAFRIFEAGTRCAARVILGEERTTWGNRHFRRLNVGTGSEPDVCARCPKWAKRDVLGPRLPAQTFFAVVMPPRFILRDSLDRHRLEKLYLRDGLSMVQIGKRFGVSATAVCRLMDEYDIRRRMTITADFIL